MRWLLSWLFPLPALPLEQKKFVWGALVPRYRVTAPVQLSRICYLRPVTGAPFWAVP